MKSVETATDEHTAKDAKAEQIDSDEIELAVARSEEELPEWADRATLARFFHKKMVPYHDELEDVDRGLEYAFSDLPGFGGFVIVARWRGELVGGVTFLQTGMKGYIPENLLLFIAVDPKMRNRGVGRQLIDRALDECEGSVKLHVEPENPARRLYERAGFETKYLEMRLKR